MKTDKFDDAIRQKLESIEPPYRERDWAHMQTFMHRHGYPSAWTGVSQWLMPMAAAAAVTGLIISTVWQFHTNRDLNQLIQTLTKTVTRLETTQATLIERQRKTDSLYVTTFTNTPGAVGERPPVNDQYTTRQPAGRSIDSYAPKAADAPLRTADNDRPAQNDRLAGNDQTAQNGRPSTAGTVGKLVENERVTGNDGIDANPSRSDGQLRKRMAEPVTGEAYTEAANRESRTASARTVAPSQPARSNGRPQQLYGRQNRPESAPADRLSQRSAPANGAPANASGQSGMDERSLATGRDASAGGTTGRDGAGLPPVAAEPARTESIALLTIRPVVFDSAYYVESMARRKRRIRSLTPAAVVLPPVAASVEVAGSRPAAGVRVRLGVIGEVGTAQKTAGGYGEVLIGRHWGVGIGLNRTHVQGTQFGDENQFERMTHDDFRKLYAPGVDPRNKILNIDQQFMLWQLPVSVSYRGGLGKGFSLVPSVGMNVSLAARETTTFTYWRGMREIPSMSNQFPPRALSCFNTYTVALGAEKSWKYLVLQAGPVLSGPVTSQPVPVSLSLRTRILFQF